MGIPKLFITINKNNITSNAIKENIKDNIEHKFFFIDYNSIIHTTSQKFINNLNESKKKVENIDDIIIDLCVEEINLLIKTFSKSKLDLLYIAIDGVPSMGKMIEQKKRRYMNTIINEYKKILKEKYKNELQKSFLPNKMNRYDYKEISFDKNKISPGTDFMKKLTKKLKSSKFNTKKYILSSFDEIGEGEKKILDYILQNNLDNCLIYSPDADMILLLCLLKNTNINILRHNQQTSTPEEDIYDLINIDLFKQNLYSYIDFDLDKDKFIKDIVFLSSIFGNDFIPKIESIDVENNFQQLLDIYLDTYKSVNNYLVLFDKKYILNTNFFVDFLKKYLEFEQFNINEKYMNETYRFYRKFKNIYSLEYENVNHTNFDDINKQFNDKLDDFIKNPMNYKKDNIFINQLKQIIQPNIIDTNLDNNIFLKKFIVIKNNKRFSWDKFTFTSNIPFHKNRINSMIKNGYNTNYDKELYIFINILDKYDKMFRKKIKYNITNDMIINYIEGILWTFNYYFNKTNNVSYWYYKYKDSVFVSDIYSYIYKNPNSLKDIYNNLKKYDVTDLNKYFTPDKQLEFISPKDKLIKKIINNLGEEINCKTKFINQCDIKSL